MMKPVLTTFALKVAAHNSNVVTWLAAPNARLPIEMPDKTIRISGGMRTAQIFLSTHSLLMIIKDVKPKRMLETESKALLKSKGTSI